MVGIGRILYQCMCLFVIMHFSFTVVFTCRTTELKGMANRVDSMRAAILSELKKTGVLVCPSIFMTVHLQLPVYCPGLRHKTRHCTITVVPSVTSKWKYGV